MSTGQEKQQIEQLKSELKFAEKNHASKVRERDFRLLKLTLIMVILTVIAGLIYGRIKI